MRILCPNCGTRLDLDEAQFAGQRPAQVKCWMCTQRVLLPDSSDTEPGPPTIAVKSSVSRERSRASRLDGGLAPQTTSLTLPQNETIKISVITGLSLGIECELSRPLVTIGRLGGGADIEVDDPEVSRLHCAVEVRPGAIFLNDLSSTNGTYIGESRILAARLEHLSKFRIGSTLLQMSVLSARERLRD
jgi:predicted Zn finger-like uncharacterized protein